MILISLTGVSIAYGQNDLPPPPSELIPDGADGGDQLPPPPGEEVPPPPGDVDNSQLPPPNPGSPSPGTSNGFKPKKETAYRDADNPFLGSLSDNNIHAQFVTNKGRFSVVLKGREAPIAVSNFIGLAMGTKVFTEISGRKVRRPFYDGLTIHQVTGKSTIHFGCPFGNGTGGPGFQIEDEVENGLSFDRAYMLAYANYGPNTNGSQLFINVVPRPDLNNGFTIFGEVIEGQEVLNKIANVDVDALQRPMKPIIIEKVEVYKVDK